MKTRKRLFCCLKQKSGTQNICKHKKDTLSGVSVCRKSPFWLYAKAGFCLFKGKIAASKENPLKELLCVFPGEGFFFHFQVVVTVSSNNFVLWIMQANYKDCLRIQTPLIEQRDLRRLQLDFRIQCPRFGRTYCYEFLEFFFALNMHGFVD